MKHKIQLKDKLNFCDKNDVIFLMGCVQEQSASLFGKFVLFEGEFYTYASGFVARDIK